MLCTDSHIYPLYKKSPEKYRSTLGTILDFKKDQRPKTETLGARLPLYVWLRGILEVYDRLLKGTQVDFQ